MSLYDPQYRAKVLSHPYLIYILRLKIQIFLYFFFQVVLSNSSSGSLKSFFEHWLLFYLFSVESLCLSKEPVLNCYFRHVCFCNRLLLSLLQKHTISFHVFIGICESAKYNSFLFFFLLNRKYPAKI